MSVEFQPAVIVQFAARLYKQAERLVLTWALALAFLGGVIGGGAAVAAHFNPLLGAAVIALMGGLFGAAYGREKGFELRLRAQEAMCQLQIEMNTRPR